MVQFFICAFSKQNDYQKLMIHAELFTGGGNHIKILPNLNILRRVQTFDFCLAIVILVYAITPVESTQQDICLWFAPIHLQEYRDCNAYVRITIAKHEIDSKCTFTWKPRPPGARLSFSLVGIIAVKNFLNFLVSRLKTVARHGLGDAW